MGRDSFKTVKNVAVEDMMLDVHNARIRVGVDQNDCIHRIIQESKTFLALAENIAKEGLTTIPILATPNNNGTFTIKDGNRRTTALKLLNNPELSPDEAIKKKIILITNKYQNFPSHVDISVTNDEQAMIKEVLGRHLGEQGGIGQKDWSAYLRTIYLINHENTAEYKRPGQYCLWVEEHNIPISDKFPISTLQRILTTDNLKLLGFDIDENDNLKINAYESEVIAMAKIIIDNLEKGEITVDHVFKPDQVKNYIEKIRISVGLDPKINLNNSKTESNNNADQKSSKSDSGNLDKQNDNAEESDINNKPNSRAKRTPDKTSADRKHIFGSKRSSPGINIPTSGFPKESNLVVELRNIDVTVYPIAASMLLRALIELSDLHYRNRNNLDDKKGLAKNVRNSATHMKEHGMLTENQENIVTKLCNKDNSIYEIETLQQMIHKNTHNLDHHFVNIFWDNIGCFVKACWP